MRTLTQELLESVFTAETIMTARRELYTADADADLHQVHAEASDRRFDVVPVTRNGAIIGLLHGEMSDVQPLTREWLISHDTSIPDLIQLFIETGRSGFLVLRIQDIIGYVTPADLNKIPARTHVYNLVGELELELAEWIKRHSHEANDHLSLLSSRRRAQIQEQLETLQQGDADVDVIQLLNLSDLVNIIVKRAELRAQLGYSSRNEAEAALGGVVHLRNATMHTVRPLIEQYPEDLHRLRDRLQRAERILEQLNPESDDIAQG
jgi:hypothetical protein